MSLNWNLSKIKDRENVCWVGEPDAEGKSKMSPLLNCLIWASLAVGLDKIEEKNVREWRFRLSFLKRCGFSAMTKKDDEYIPTDAELSRFVGLSTNVSTKTRHQFIASVAKCMASELERDLRKEDEVGKAVNEAVKS